MIAVLAITSLTVKAQTDEFDNAISCTLQIRPICIDENATPCTHSLPGAGWTTLLPSTSGIPITPIGGLCSGAGIVQGYEVRYHPSTGCTDNALFTTNPATPCNHANYSPVHVNIPDCPSCTTMPPGHRVLIDYDHINNRFHAHY